MLKFKPESQDQLMLLPPSIEDFIPDGHLSKVVYAVVDRLDTISIEKKYSYLGQKSYSPKLLLRLLFYGYATGLRSGRRIASACESDTAFMYLSSMHRPDFRTINDFRKDNIKFIQEAFVQIVLICKELGMAKAGSIIIDSTKLKANANIKHSKTKEQYEAWLQQINTDIEKIILEASDNDIKENEIYGEQRGDELPQDLKNKVSLKKKIEQALNKFDNDTRRVNLEDPEAKLIKGPTGINTNYNCQTAISEDGIIVCAFASDQASDRTETLNVINNTESNIAETVTDIIADSGYASYQNYEELEQMGKTCYIPDQQLSHDLKLNNNQYHRNQFKYDVQTDTYICPQGKELHYAYDNNDKRNKQKSRVYKCQECLNCNERAECTKGRFRQIHRELRENLRESVRERLQTPTGKQKMIQRKRIESIFGNIKYNLGYRHLSLKGKAKSTAEWQLICLTQNIRKIHQNKVFSPILN